MRRELAKGLTMITEDELLLQLGDDVGEETLRNWSRWYGVRRVKMDGAWWYHLEAAIEAEFETGDSGRGRPRGSGSARSEGAAA